MFGRREQLGVSFGDGHSDLSRMSYCTGATFLNSRIFGRTW